MTDADDWNIGFTESHIALEVFQKHKSAMTQGQIDKLLNARITYCMSEYHVLSGPDLMRDRAGFGVTIAAAVEDYLSIYSN